MKAQTQTIEQLSRVLDVAERKVSRTARRVLGLTAEMVRDPRSFHPVVQCRASDCELGSPAPRALTGGLGEVMQESARVALSWVQANAARCGIDPGFHRGADIHVHVQSGALRKDGASAGAAMVAAMVSALTGRVVRGDLAMTGETSLAGQVLPVAGIRERVLAAHRYGLARVILPSQNRKHVDEELGDGLRCADTIEYVTRIHELLDLALRPAAAAGEAVAVTPAGRVS